MTTVAIAPLWKIEDVAAFLQVPMATLYQWRHQGVGPRAFKVADTGGTTRRRFGPGQQTSGRTMRVDDLWCLKKRGADGERLKAKRYGQGKRSRCRYTYAAGIPRTRFFDRRVDADTFDAKARAGLTEEVRTKQGRLTFQAYAERWRSAREVGVAAETRRRWRVTCGCTCTRPSGVGRGGRFGQRTSWSG
jgi:hypothetical protein